ncbi:hypothetical protein HYX10_00355 [Candidatus Woesearchaeota archaeon]|nr:hypothetical protein [Candidatus Woesearchaeota archaeon]
MVEEQQSQRLSFLHLAALHMKAVLGNPLGCHYINSQTEETTYFDDVVERQRFLEKHYPD